MKVLRSCLKLLTLLSISEALAVEDTDSSVPKDPITSFLRGRDKSVSIVFDRQLEPETHFCGCPGCDADAFNVYAGDYKCGDRISYLQFSLGFPERDACIRVAEGEFPEECGLCDPNSCISEQPPPPPPSTGKCGCPECDDVWDTLAGAYSCGSRIDWLQSPVAAYVGGPFEENVACTKIASEEYPLECGKCDPSRCNNAITSPPSMRPTPPPTYSPTVTPTGTPTGKPTSAPTEAPTPSPTKTPTESPVDDNNIDNNSRCACSTCTDAVMDSFAGDYKCGDRISYLQDSLGYSERDACSQVAGSEFPSECGGCDPGRCDQPGYNNDNDDNNNNNNNGNNPRPGGQKCGGAVNASGNSQAVCQSDLWNPTGDSSMYCFAYGGSGDPCHLNNNNDPNDGIFKDPSACSGDTLYLWDEPDTQGKSYDWAGRTWLDYSVRFSQQLQEFRARGGKITGPLLKAGGPGVLRGNQQQFYDSCGPACRDPTNPAYIDIIAINAFCGPFNGPAGCRGGASFIYNEAIATSSAFGNIPVYITNWSRLQTPDPQDQVEAINSIEEFFPESASSNPIVERVYWFGATDFGGGSSNNFLTNVLPDGSTLGEFWRAKCDSL